VSTPLTTRQRDGGARLLDAGAPGLARGRGADPAELVALVVGARREILLRMHRRRLRREDLEDCFSQASLELVVQARRGASFSDAAHVARMLEHRFLSRVQDRRRAIDGRSPAHAAFELALADGLLDGSEDDVADPRAEVEALVERRLELQRINSLIALLTADQRLVLESQLYTQIDGEELCDRLGWSYEKYRKVAQRARARLRLLLEA
jgi:DNA-directed RNA polymerase specialized sigma24 family protein